MSTRPKKCCVKDCEDYTSIRHRFPIKLSETFAIWVEKINHPRFAGLTNEEIHSRYVVCHRHFDKSCEVLGWRKLRRDAVPTLFIPGVRFPPGSIGRLKYTCHYSGCTNSYYSGIYHPTYENKHFYTFPKNPERREEWKSICGISKNSTLKNYYVCEDHFDDTSFVNVISNKRLCYLTTPTRTPNRKKGIEYGLQMDPYYMEYDSDNSEDVDVHENKEISRYAGCEDLVEPVDDTLSNTVTNIVIRQATRDDMNQVFVLIKALAEFQKLEDPVKITTETLIAEGFDSNSPAFSCLVAEVNSGPIVGYAIYYTAFSTFVGKSTFLENLYVDSFYRRCGIGTQLMMSVAKVALETNNKLDFHVLKSVPAADFYKKLGAENLSETKEWQIYRLNEESLNKLFES